jgi:acetyl-CoA carboxylase biotin carboxyl carrier protein
VSLSDDDVLDILRLLDTLPFDEFELETGRFTLTLRRSANGQWTRETQVAAGKSRPAGPGQEPGEPSQARAAEPPEPQEPAGTPGGEPVLAPLPGTFYRAPQPGAAPFVEVGSQVGEDTVVAIIETMKLMNPVYPPAAGTIGEICLADGEFAAADAVLMRLVAETG